MRKTISKYEEESVALKCACGCGSTIVFNKESFDDGDYIVYSFSSEDNWFWSNENVGLMARTKQAFRVLLNKPNIRADVMCEIEQLNEFIKSVNDMII